MLKSLDSIAWDHIKHASGKAGDVPKWIRALRSDSEEVRVYARANLFECSNHQGGVYEVSSYLVPFLVELAADPDTPEKGALLHHLAHLVEASTDMARAGRYGDHEAATYEAVKAGMDVYLALLDDPAGDVRLAAFTVLAVLRDPETLWMTVSRLLFTASRETDPDSLAEMIRMLASYMYVCMPNRPSDAFARQMAPLLSWLASQLAPDHAPRVQFQAALAHLTLVGGAQPEALVDLTWVLGDVLANPEKYSTDISSFRVESMMLAALAGLEYLPRAWRMAILAEALPSAKFAGDAHLIAYALLENLFFGTVRTNEIDRVHMRPFLRRARLSNKDSAERPANSTTMFRLDIREQSGQLRPPGRRYVAAPLPADLVALSDTERRLLRLVLDTDMVWMVHSNLLEVYGLPVLREEARALLDAADAANMGQPSPRTAT